VYASHPPSPTTAQHSLPGGALPPYRGRFFTGTIASASPDAPEPEVRIHLPPAESPSLSLISPSFLEKPGFPVIESAKLNGLNPQHYIADVLVRIA
jgi:hypothetical protein